MGDLRFVRYPNLRRWNSSTDEKAAEALDVACAKYCDAVLFESVKPPKPIVTASDVYDFLAGLAYEYRCRVEEAKFPAATSKEVNDYLRKNFEFQTGKRLPKGAFRA